MVCSIEITEDSNITSSNYKESITNMVNKVRIYDGEGKTQGVVQNDADVKKYGIFQQTYTKEEGKDATTTAKSMFKTVEKTFTLECVNLNEAVTGAGAVVRDSSTGLSGVVWIDADTHTWQNGVATMSLTVTLKQMMDTRVYAFYECRLHFTKEYYFTEYHRFPDLLFAGSIQYDDDCHVK